MAALDTRNADASAWIVKVPYSLASVWRAACEQSMAGQVDDLSEAPALLGRIISEEGDVSILEVPEHLVAEGNPRRFKLTQMPLPPGDASKMHVLSYEAPPPAPQQQQQNVAAAGPSGASGAREVLKPRVDGTVSQRLDMVPMVKDDKGAWVMDPSHMQVVRGRTERAAEKLRVVSSYEDLSLDNRLADMAQHKRIAKDMHSRRKANEAASKADNLKRPRLEKDELEEVLFRLFERHSAWAFKSLILETRQPHMHLKAVLEGIAAQQKRGPNKDKYELKAEYRGKANAGARPAAG